MSMVMDYAHSLQGSTEGAERCAGDMLEKLLPQFMAVTADWERRGVRIDDAIMGLARASGELMQLALNRAGASPELEAELLPEIVGTYGTAAGASVVEVESRIKIPPTAMN